MTYKVIVDRRMDGWEMNEDELRSLQASLYRYCLSLTGAAVDAEDLAQQTWAKSIKRMKERGHVNPEAFLLRVAKNGWIDECRRRRYLKERLELLQEKGESCSEEDTVDVDRAIVSVNRHLSPIQRTVFMLRDVLGYSIAETADLLETSDGAVKAALHRARRALSEVREELLREEEAGEDDVELAVDPWEEALAREIREAYTLGRTDELIRLLYAQPAAPDALTVVGRMAQSQSSHGSPSHRPFSSTMLMSA